MGTQSSDPLLEDYAAVESRLLADDNLYFEPDTIAQFDYLRASTPGGSSVFRELIAETPLHNQSSKRKIDDLKVEGPLTPPHPDVQLYKRVRLNSTPKIVHEIGPTENLRAFDCAEEGIDPADHDESISQLLLPVAEQAQQSLRTERLIEADSIKRVQVPLLPQAFIVPPWEQSHAPLQAHNVVGDADKMQSWSGNGKIERQLPWTPFSLDLARVQLDEHVNHDALLQRMVLRIENSDTLDTASLCWKRDGFRAVDLAYESDEEELEPASFDKDRYRLEDIVRQHRNDANLRSQNDHDVAEARRRPEAKHKLDERQPRIRNDAAPEQPRDFGNGLLFGGGLFGAADIAEMLNNKEQSIRHAAVSRTQAGTPLLPEEPQQPVSPKAVARSVPLPVPDLPESPSNQTVIVRTSFFSNRRSLFAQIEKLHPSLELVERQWDVGDRRKHADPIHALSMPDDGDIIASTSSTMIITSIASVKQRPLPGQEAYHYGLKERIANVALRFEHITVVVSHRLHAANDTERDMDVRDAQALAEFVGFGAHVAKIEVIFVPGEEPALAKWIVALLSRSASDDAGSGSLPKLLPEQTMRESFLRRLGLNAYAAQAVLNNFKMLPVTDAANSSSSNLCDHITQQRLCGLVAFLTIASDKLSELPASLLGGEVARRLVADRLGKGWNTN